MGDEPSVHLLARWRDGDQSAAQDLFDRYAGRLVALARSRLSPRLAHHIAPEDLVQSAYRSFFCDARDGQFDLRRSGDLWRLLVAITLHKLQDQVRYNGRAKRRIDRARPGPADAPLDELAARDPSPVEAAALVEEVERLMRDLGPQNGRVLELRLQGHNVRRSRTPSGAAPAPSVGCWTRSASNSTVGGRTKRN